MNIKEITEDELKGAVDRSRNGKAPGYDIIPNAILFYKMGNKAMICRLTIQRTAQERYLKNGARQKYIQYTNRKETI